MNAGARRVSRPPAGLALAWWVVWSIPGVALLATPDADTRLFSFSADHGPSPTDVVGMLVLIVGWLPVAWALVRHPNPESPTWRAAVLVALGGAVALAVTIRLDLGRWWLLAAATVVAAQVVAYLRAS